jgi:hypothetical protein
MVDKLASKSCLSLLQCTNKTFLLFLDSKSKQHWDNFVASIGLTGEEVRHWSFDVLNQELADQKWKGQNAGGVQTYWQALQRMGLISLAIARPSHTPLHDPLIRYYRKGQLTWYIYQPSYPTF